MKKISKIIICCIMAVTVIALTCFTTFATYGDNSGSYGSVTYTPISNTGAYLEQLSMPIVVDSTFPTFGNYVSGTNRRFQTYNNSGIYANVRLILPNKGGEYYVSSACMVKLDYTVQYDSKTLLNLLNSSASDTLFALPKVVDALGNEYSRFAGAVSIDVYVKPYDEDEVVKTHYGFELRSSMFIKTSDIPILDNLPDNSAVAFHIKWTPKQGLDYRSPDLSISLPRDFKPLSFSINEVNYEEAYDKGKLEGIEIGKDAALEGVENANAVLNFFQGILEAVQGTLNTFFELEVFGFQLGNIVAILLSALVVIVVLKIIL